MTALITREFYSRPTTGVARALIGQRLVRTVPGCPSSRMSGIIVETEAYGASEDTASHARMGPTPRNSMMFGDVGRSYVYFTYGAHFCFNITARSPRQKAGAVLVRAIMPVEGIEMMKSNRACEDLFALASGPGKLARALMIGPGLNGVDVTDPESGLHMEYGTRPERILSTPRIGITRALNKNWRFVDPTSEFISRRLRIKV